MSMESLITSLSQDLRPVSSRAHGARIFYGLLGGVAITLALVISILGSRSDLSRAILGFSFWMKWTYTGSLAVAASFAVARFARPNPAHFRWLWLLAVPVMLLAGIAIVELIETPTRDWLTMWHGATWRICPWLILTLAMPVFIGILWSLHNLAPTRLRAAGSVAGLAAGAWAAFIYCIHCPEVAAAFVLTWYNLGIGLAAGFGALLGPRLLRW